MLNTGLTEQEKESLIKYICTCGQLKVLDDGRYVFEFFDKQIDVDSDFSAGKYLKKAFINILNQSLDPSITE